MKDKQITIYHNPRCSKSRQTLSVLQEKGIFPTIIEYLKDPPSISELKQILILLNLKTRDIIRKKEQAYQDLNLSNSELETDELLQALVENPILIERPIVVSSHSAVIGRPPESVLPWLDNLDV